MPKKGVIPAGFLKHPPPSWGKGKGKKTGTRGNSMSGEKNSRRNKKGDIHVIPDAVGALAISLPFVTIAPGTSQSALDVLAGMAKGEQTLGQGFTNVLTAVSGNIMPDILPMAELGILAVAFKWFGKKLGLNKVGGKRVKIA